MTNNGMRTNHAIYEAPETWVVEVNTEGIICASGSAGPTGNRQDYGSPNDRDY